MNNKEYRREYLRWDGVMEQVTTRVQESVSTLNQAKKIASSGDTRLNSFTMSTSSSDVGIANRLLKRPLDLELRTSSEYVRVF